MNLLKKLFGNNQNNIQPVEPIFPGERFSIFKLTFPDGWGLATFNSMYNNYPNKPFFPWHVLIELEIVNKNDNGHPIDTEADNERTRNKLWDRKGSQMDCSFGLSKIKF